MSGRRLAIAVVVGVAAAVLLAAIWVGTRPAAQPPSKTSYTTAEFVRLHPWYDGQVGDSWKIQDVAIDAKLIRTPGLHFWERGDVTVNGSERMEFTYVTFPNAIGFYFIGDRRSDFRPGPVQFNVTLRNWDYGRQTDPDLEHNYVYLLLWGYDNAIRRGTYRPFEAKVTRENTTLRIQIVSVEDVFPFPARWNELYVQFLAGLYREEGPRNGTLLSNGQPVATLTRPAGDLWGLRNRTVDLEFGVGQEIRVRYDPQIDLYDHILIYRIADNLGLLAVPL